MPKILKITAAFSFTAAVFTTALFYCSDNGRYLTLAITFGTTAYHLGIRLFVGLLFQIKMKNRADYTKQWYQLHPWEHSLYRFLRVKSWKGRMPTFDPGIFSRQKHSWDEIAQAMCQSELVHETNMVFSFLPLIASLWFGSFSVFLVTSVCGAVLDSLFVMMQRYNRARILTLLDFCSYIHENH